MAVDRARVCAAVDLMTHPPEARVFDAADLQYARRWLARGLDEAERISDPKLRAVVRRALLVAASEFGCVVCGQAIDISHLQDVPMVRRALVHLYGRCADVLAERLGMTVDQIMRGEAL